MKKISLLFILVSVLGIPFAKAQQDFIVNSLSIIPQSNYNNPGMFKPMGGYVGLPVMSSVYANFNNSGFKYKDLFLKPGGAYGDSLLLNLDVPIKNMGKHDRINLNLAIDLFNLGFKIKRNYFMLSVREVVNARFSYSQNFFKFLYKGNGAFLGQTADLSDLAVNLSHYREYGLGYSREVNDKLSLGIRLKYLYGMENIYTAKNNSSLYTDANSFDITAQSDVLVHTSGLTKFDTITNDIPEYLFGRDNFGWGIDLGGEYKINEKFSVSASVLDIGRLYWRDAVNKSYSVNRASFQFQGMDLAYYVNHDKDLLQVLGDSLKDVFEVKESQQNYSSPLNTRFYVNGNYLPFKNTTVGVSFLGEVGKNYFNPNASLSISQRLGNLFHVSANWSYMNRSASNVGFGFAFQVIGIQLYAAADNVLAAIWPQSAKNIHAHVGLNVLIDYRKDRKTKSKDAAEEPKKGKKSKDKDADGIEDKEDKCPDVPGYLKFNGCPDKDQDGVQDSEDQCPDSAGVIENKGCPWPDSDKDGLIDREDSCVNDAGPLENKGCPWPDTDKDGVDDNTDQCKDIPGPAANNGCPYGDSDKDGINDDKDKCPYTPGPIDNGGCPFGDKDGDGTKDNLDNCPDNPGPMANSGCPYGDEDGDGVKDDVDQCPKTPGVPENQGCPKIEEKNQAILDLAFKNLEFKSGTAIISTESFFSLYKLADLMKKEEKYKLLISGHTDNVGNDATNMELSRKRAEAVKTFLIGQGVQADRLKAEWFGKTKPIADNATPEGRDRNRRVEMKVVFE
ncbi:MAG: OmpA family protein [Bacteroidia bacterium]|nr:OmpA family protein [Bacteroidia bacterium]